MPNSLKAKLSKLKYKHQITDEEYRELIAKLNRHDEIIRAIARVEVFEEILENIIPTLYENDVEEETINECKTILKQMKGEQDDQTKCDS